MAYFGDYFGKSNAPQGQGITYPYKPKDTATYKKWIMQGGPQSGIPYEEFAVQNLGIRTATAGTEAAEFTTQRAKEAWELEKKSAANTQKLTEQFLNQWGVGMDTLKDIYAGILGGEGGTTQGGAFGGLNDLVKQITDEYTEFKSTYQPLETEALESARGELGIRKEALGQLQDLARPDYEGVAGRATADVAGQSEMARQAETREQMRLGIDPTSGRFGSLTRRSRLEEAKNRAIASNLARRGEKERVTGISATTAQIADPTVGGNIALGIRGAGKDYLKTAAQLKESGVKTAADIAGGFSRDVVRPYGEIGYTLLGRNLASGYGIPSSLPTEGKVAGYQTPGRVGPGSLGIG